MHMMHVEYQLTDWEPYRWCNS